MSDKANESSSILSPFKQNEDYSGNFLDKIRERNKKRKQRKQALVALAQEIPKVGDFVKIKTGKYAGLEGLVLTVEESDDFGTLFEVAVKLSEEIVISDSPYSLSDFSHIVKNQKTFSSEDIQKAYSLLKNKINDYHNQFPEQKGAPDTEFKDPSLTPVFNKELGFFTFPNYKNGIYGSINDDMVRYIHEGRPYMIKALLAKSFEKLLPEIKRIAVDTLSVLDYSALIDNENLYDIIKIHYPQYFSNAVTKTLEQGRVFLLPTEKLEDVYLNFKEEFIQFLVQNRRDLDDYFVTTSKRKEALLSFIVRRLLNREDPELYEAFKSLIGSLNVSTLYTTGLYKIYPEEVKDKFLAFNNWNINETFEVAQYIPEIKNKSYVYFINNPPEVFRHAENFLRLFNSEERSKIYEEFKNSQSPANIIHAVKTSKNDYTRTIVEEISQEIWDKVASKVSPNYLLYIDVGSIILISEEILKSAYDEILNNVDKYRSYFKNITESNDFNRLLKKYGLNFQQVSSIVSDLTSDAISESSRLKVIIDNYIKGVLEKINQQEYTKQDWELFKSFTRNGHFALSEGELLNEYIPVLEKNKNVFYDSISRHASSLFYYITSSLFYNLDNKIKNKEEPFLSERAALSFLKILEYTYKYTYIYIPEERLFDFRLLSLVNTDKDENFLREYARLTAKVNPMIYIMTDGISTTYPEISFGENITVDDYIKKHLNLDLSKLSSEEYQRLKEEFSQNFKKIKEKLKIIPLAKRFPEFLDIALEKISIRSSKQIDSIFEYIVAIFDGIENIPEKIVWSLYEIFIREPDFSRNIFAVEESSGEEIPKTLIALSKQFPKSQLRAVSYLSKYFPLDFLNSPYLFNKEFFKDEIEDSINHLKDNHFRKGFNSKSKEFLLRPENRDILLTLIKKAQNLNVMPDLITQFPKIEHILKEMNIDTEVVPIRNMREINDYEQAKQLYKFLKNDIPVKDLPPEIKINKSIYQDQQRPDTLMDYGYRYTISNNNISPTRTLYDIGKKLIHAGDGVAHNNVGVSGFTNSWALVTYAEIQDEEGIIIEQYQSDYPPVLAHLFNNKPVLDEDGFEREDQGRGALQRLIRQYGDQEAIKEYISQFTSIRKEVPESIKNIKVENFGFTHSATAQRLYESNINTIGELLEYTRNDLLKMPSVGRRTLADIEETLQKHDLSLPTKDELEASNTKPEDIELPIELAPEVKDARTHFEYISKAYPFLAIINTIKVAQAQNIKYIYINADASKFAEIANQDKSQKLYKDIPSTIGELFFEPKLDLNLWKIPANNETIEKLQVMLKEETGKSEDYNFALTPAQNQKIKEKKLQDLRRKKQQWNSTPEKQEKLKMLEQEIRDKLPMAEVPNFYSPQQALRFLGENVKGKILGKRTYNKEFADIARELGILARAARRAKRMIKLATIQRKTLVQPEWAEGVPSFDWLNHGNIGKIKKYSHEAFNEFIDLNSDKFAIWNPQKYLGSGLTGDAWLLEDGRILKIFDANAKVGDITDLERYRRIEQAQFEGTADPSLPRIYEVGLLEMPNDFYSFESPNKLIRRHIFGSYYKPAYVVLERLNTPTQKAKDYLHYNPYLLDPLYQYDEESDDWIEREKEPYELPIISEEEVPWYLKEEYLSFLQEDIGYDEFIQKFIKDVLNEVISNMINAYENIKEESEESLLNNEKLKNLAIAKLENSIYWCDNISAINKVEEILNLNHNWRRELAKAIINNLERNMTDLHSGNFGFRNGHIVYFDA